MITSELEFSPIVSEIDNFETGLLIEVWDKGMLWDNTIGYYWEPLQKILHSTQLVSLFIIYFYAAKLNSITSSYTVDDIIGV